MSTPTRAIAASPAAPLRPGWATWRLWRILSVAWSGFCLAALLLLTGVRWLRYTSWSGAPNLDRVLRELMVVDGQAFLWTWAYSMLNLRIVLLAVALLVVGLLRSSATPRISPPVSRA